MTAGRSQVPAPPWRVLLIGLAAVVGAAACSGSDATADGADQPETPSERTEADAAAQAADDAADVFADLAGTDRPGCAAAVSVEGEVVFSGGFGAADVERGAPITPTTRFDVASVSKSLTAATTLVLVENGVLSLDDSIGTWLPEVPETWEEVTVDDLLHHTSGLPPYEPALAEQIPETAASTPDDALAVLLAQPDLEFEPGTDWEYSNSGYFLLSLIVARATGEEFADVVASQVLEPVGMADTFVRTDWDEPVEDGAAGYAVAENGSVVPYESRWAQNGDGAAWSTVLDLLAWADEWETAAALGEGVQREMQTPAVLDDGTALDYGSGLELRTDEEGRTVIGHSGEWLGYSSLVLLHPDESVAGAITCNIDGDDTIEDRMADLLDIWLEG